MPNDAKAWLRDQVNGCRDEAIRQKGREEGKIEAYEHMQNLLDPEQYCQECGEHFYGTMRYQEDHYKSYPDHKPGYVPPEAQ